MAPWPFSGNRSANPAPVKTGAGSYFKVDLEIVWKTIQGSLPDLHAQITEVSATLSRNSDHEGMQA